MVIKAYLQRSFANIPLLVMSSCHNKIPQTEVFGVFFLTVLEAGKSKVNVPAHLVPGEDSLPGL